MAINCTYKILAICILFTMVHAVTAAEPQAIDIGSRLELFVDDYLIDKSDGVLRKLHSPQRRNVAIRFDKPWEGGSCTK